MAKPRPAFQIYAADFYADTATLSQAEVGALVRIMCQFWRGNQLLSDAEREEAALGPITEKMRHHIEREAGKLGELVGEYDRLSSLRSEVGKLGGRPKAKANQKESKHKAKEVEVRVGVTVEGEVEVERGSRQERAHEPEVEPTFKQWFDLYDKRKALGECQVKWRTIDQGTREAIMAHTARLVATTPKEYRKDPIRYLTKRGWEDEIIQRTITPTIPKHMTDEEYVRESARVAYEAHQRRTAAAAQS